MSSPIDFRAGSPIFVSVTNVRRSLNGFMAAYQDDQAAITPKPNIDGTEQLLDIDELLEIERLIEKIKKDGRLNSEGEVRLKHADL